MKREKFLLDAVNIAINLLDYDLYNYKDIGNKDAAKEVNASMNKLKALRKKYEDKKEQDLGEFGILSILSIHRSQLPASLIPKLFDEEKEIWVYSDTTIGLEEHLFSCVVADEPEEYISVLSREERKALEKLSKRLAEEDCSYFRFIN